MINLWNENQEQFVKIYCDKINQLFNQELPKLVFEDLIKRKVIDNRWEYIKGDFDIKKAHLKGWLIKKKSWKSSSYAIYSNRMGVNNEDLSSRGFYPLIFSKEQPNEVNYVKKYCSSTNTKVEIEGNKKLIEFRVLNQKLKEIWWTNFPNSEFRVWNDEIWSEIKENGKTVAYISKFLEKLIIASSSDLNKIENIEESEYSEKEFEVFVNKFDWTFAKTYAASAPNEYIALSKIGFEHKQEFVKIAQFIRDKGFKAYYYTRVGYYYQIGENYYWTMDEKVEDTDLINRAIRNDYELINNSWKWKGN